MHLMKVSNLPIYEEDEVNDQVAELYNDTKRVLESPYVPNLMKALATSPPILSACNKIYRTFYEHISLPHSLIAMISYCVPNAKNCTYCAANGELTCRTLGIDEATLNMLANDLGNVSPLRIRAIIEFAIKSAVEPQALVEADYDNVRSFGITDEEIIEIIFIAGIANFSDTLADALKLEVDEMVANALGWHSLN